MGARAHIMLVCTLGIAGGCTRELLLDAPTDDSDPPSVCIPSEVPGFRLPSARWGLAAAHASRRLDDDPSDGIALSPAFFLATGWQATAFGCAEYGPPWRVDPEAQGDAGCLAIQQGTTWHEVAVLYPEIYESDAAWKGTLQGDQPERSVMTLAWATVAAHALWAREDVKRDPATYYAQSQDPRAVETLSALMHVSGPWTTETAQAMRDCPDDLASCLGDSSRPHVSRLLEKLARLEEAPCHTEPLDERDVEAYIDALSELWPDPDWADIEIDAQRSRSLSSHLGYGGQVNAVLDVLDNNLDQRLACPEQTLWSVYRYSCP